MCQLLGINCAEPSDLSFSWSGFSARSSSGYSDGFGIAFFERRAARVFLDPHPASSSPLADFLRQHPIRTTHAIAHLRRATQGDVSLANAHPFSRELWGRHWVFAHNGDLDWSGEPSFSRDRFAPVGETDSERAFCWMLSRLSDRFSAEPSGSDLFEALGGLTAQLERRGIFNFILSNGSHLFAFCSSKLHLLERQPPFGVAELCDLPLRFDLSSRSGPSDRFCLLATDPLTRDEPWRSLPRGSLWMFESGRASAWRQLTAGREPKGLCSV